MQVAESLYLLAVMTENNGVSEKKKQCLSCKCHVSNIDFHKSSFRNNCLPQHRHR